MKVILDSNILVSSLDPEDIFHSECIPIFERIINFDIEVFCPLLVLVETTCVIRRRTNNESIGYAVYRNLFNQKSINWLEMTADAAEKACILGNNTGLRGGDAIVLQAAEQYGYPLITKDRELIKKAPKGIFVFEPSDLPL